MGRVLTTHGSAASPPRLLVYIYALRRQSLALLIQWYSVLIHGVQVGVCIRMASASMKCIRKTRHLPMAYCPAGDPQGPWRERLTEPPSGPTPQRERTVQATRR